MKNILRSAALFFLLLAASAEGASFDAVPNWMGSSWGILTSTLTDVLELKDKEPQLPDSSYFGPDKHSNAKKINKLLDEALEILLQGDAIVLRRQAVELRDKIPLQKLEISALRNKRIAAPENSKLPWVKTRKKIDEEISGLERNIAENETALRELNDKVASALRSMGLDLNENQIDVLMTSVVGEDLFENTVIFENVKRVVEKLAELSREDADNLEITRRYYGMYVVLNDLLIYSQEALEEKIEKDYKPQLLAIQKEAEALRKDAQDRSRQGQYSEAQRKSFQVNAASNAMTVRVAGLYIELLEAQRKRIRSSLSDLNRNRDVADNTYNTVRSTGALRNLIREGLELFDSIQALSMPEIQPFESDTIQKEFEEINKRLRK